MSNVMSTTRKLELLERNFGYDNINPNSPSPGTVLERAILRDGSLGWRLSLGPMGAAKLAFEGESLNGVFAKARNSARKGVIRPTAIAIVG